MKHDLNQLAKQFVEGEWFFDEKDQILKRTFASKDELIALGLIDEEGYLDPQLKSAILQFLGEDITNDAQGPFGDNDIFSGDIVDDGILYNLEFHQVSTNLLDLIGNIQNVTIQR